MARLEIIRGDITKMETDAIVNAANSSLMGGGGVDGAIHRAAGPELKEACLPLAPCPTGEARMTPGFRLPAKYVIHTVGPVWDEGVRNEEEKLENCYRNSLTLAMKNGLRTIAFPSISTGAYRYPLEKAASVALRAIKDFLRNNNLPEEVYMVCFDEKTEKAYNKALREFFAD